MRMKFDIKKKVIHLLLVIALVFSVGINTVSAGNGIGTASIYAANNNSYGLTAEGEVWSWGVNQHGKLGIGSSDYTDDGRAITPVKIPNFTNVKRLAAGSNHVLAIKQDGSVWGWGRSDAGQLGADFIGNPVTLPVQIIGVENVKELHAGNDFSVVLKNDGTVWTWGLHDNGRLGHGEIEENILVPTQIEGLENVKTLAVGNGHSLALKEDGTVWAWGEIKFGKIGNGTITLDGKDRKAGEWSPVKIDGLTNIVTVVAGNEHSFAIDNAGKVFAWGNNHKGQLGLGDTEDKTTPTFSQTITELKPKVLGVGGNFSYAIVEDGSAYAWGDNGHGRLGVGNRVSTDPADAFSLTPVKISAVEFTEGEYLTGVLQISSRNNHVVALLNDGTVVGWGANQHGQVGDGFTTPAQLEPALTEVTKLFSVQIEVPEIVVETEVETEVPTETEEAEKVTEETNSESAVGQETKANGGQKLANTAGNFYNLLLVGIVLVLAGGSMIFWQRKRLV